MDATTDTDGRLRVLVADDSDDVRLTLRLVLSTEVGCEVVAEAASGDDAVSAAAETQPDLAVVDLGMPGVSGPELVGRLREAALGASIVVYSGRPSSAATGLGADAYVEKGSVDAILATVMEFVPRSTP